MLSLVLLVLPRKLHTVLPVSQWRSHDLDAVWCKKGNVDDMGEKVKKGPFGGGYFIHSSFPLVLSFLFLEGILLNISGFSVFMKPYFD